MTMATNDKGAIQPQKKEERQDRVAMICVVAMVLLVAQWQW